MPSLQALQEFKASFNNIGDEIAVRKAQNIPFDDLELPNSEPAGGSPLPDRTAPDISGGLSGGIDDADFTFDDLADAAFNPDLPSNEQSEGSPPDESSGGPVPSGEAPAEDDSDFLALLDTIPDDLVPPADGPAADVPGPGTEPEVPYADPVDEPESADIPAADDFSIPDELLSGLADDLEAAPIDDLGEMDVPNGEPAAEDSGAESVDLLAGMEGLEDLGGELAEEAPGDFSMDSLDLGGELPAGETFGTDTSAETSGLDDFSIPDFDMAEDLGGETPGELPEEAPTADLAGLPAGDDFGDESVDMLAGVEDLGGELADLSPGDESGGMDFSISEDGAFDMGGEAGIETPEALAGDSFDTFNLGGDIPAAAGDMGAGTASSGGEFGDLEEFALPGIDDVFGGVPAGDRAGRPSTSAGSSGTGEASEEVEEIQLSDEDLAAFQKTLAGYPLNLRIACEELIAEQAVAPDLMSKLVKLLIRGASAKETAALAGKILGRTIPIPRGFEKSTGEALEAEQSSFAYIFVHNFLPVLRLFLMIAVVAASLFYLIYQFVYTPMRAESIYKIGYERIFAGEYQRANDRFSEAFRIHRNKDWFYRYAEAFRDERQYIYAEEKYDELLRFYPRDKKGVLDYAAMETEYRQNYAKAEDLLRRNLLDYAPNDKEGLLALGDNSLAWGEIDRSKYEDARFSYARLLERYGWTDPVVERMMKYFIRTDN
jgi:tetratricopeptide (TPR) repeat protein